MLSRVTIIGGRNCCNKISDYSIIKAQKIQFLSPFYHRQHLTWIKKDGVFFSSKSNASKSSHLEYFRLKWKVIAKAVKYLRIPALILSVYGFGYQQGIIDYSRDPKLKEHQLLTSTLADIGADHSDIKVANNTEWAKFTTDDPKLNQIVRVGSQIIEAARKNVAEELNHAIDEALQNATSTSDGKRTPMNQADALKLLSENENVLFWTDAQTRMEGRWQYILVNSEIPNAFVSEILPKRIFVTTGMFQTFIENDDEMALVLGHEVSHLILGHITEKNSVELFLRAIEVLLLSLDPTEGVLSLAYMSFLGFFRKILSSTHSREHERQADELGIKLAAMACFDTNRASQVFHKMHLYDTESGRDRAETPYILSFLETHPPSGERFQYLIEASKQENVEKYEDSTCASVKKRFMDLLKRSKEDPTDITWKKKGQ